MDKRELLTRFASEIIQAASMGQLDSKPITIKRAEYVAGPRAGAIELHAGLDAARLLRRLTQSNCAILRQFVTWDFVGEPSAFMAGRAVRLEAGWPKGLAQTDITLASLGQHPHGGNWVLGQNEQGQTCIAGLNPDHTPHWLLAGATGSGKTWALRSCICQLAGREENRLVVVDGKRGALFHNLRLQGMVGPLAKSPEDWRAALVWANREMQRRYTESCLGNQSPRLVVIVDEVQEVISDPTSAEALRRLVTLGRDARVHCVVATQHPTVKFLGGPTVLRNLVGRVALRVSDAKASEVALGHSYPRADRLLGCGDAYATSPGATHRVQVAYAVDSDFVERVGEPILDDWPVTEAEDLGIAPVGRPSPWPQSAEVAMALVAANEDFGRPWLRKRLREITGKAPGSGRADRLLELMSKALDELRGAGWQVSPA